MMSKISNQKSGSRIGLLYRLTLSAQLAEIDGAFSRAVLLQHANGGQLGALLERGNDDGTDSSLDLVDDGLSGCSHGD